MNITYRRELKHNYMIINAEQENEGEGSGYVSRILSSNGIDGILRFQLRQMDGSCQFYYEITSRQPLSRMLEGQCLRCGQIRSLVLGIAQVLERMETYLLPESCVLLEPEYIYVEPDRFRVWLCLVPGLCRDFPEEYGKLLEYLLGKVDHQDKESVVLAYGLYQETRKENYGLDDILQYLGRSGFTEDCKREQEEKPAGKASPMEILDGKAVGRGEGIRTDGKLENNEIPEKVREKLKEKPKEKSKGRGFWKKAADWWRERFSGEEPQTVQIPWEFMFEAETAAETEGRDQPAASSSQNTVLLADLSPSAFVRFRRLCSLDGENEDIQISYYPFIIGKQENLVDYVLARDTVSRLHLRIDREGDIYYARDLNSTNGTAINGRLLEANEQVLLKEGDQVSVAGYRYRFE